MGESSEPCASPASYSLLTLVEYPSKMDACHPILHKALNPFPG